MISEERYHEEFLEAVPFDEAPAEKKAALKALIEEHVRLAKSSLGQKLLNYWDNAAGRFVLFVPKPQA